MAARDDEHRKRLAYSAGFHCGYAAANTSWTDEEMRAANPPMFTATAEERDRVRGTAAWMRRFADALDAAALSARTPTTAAIGTPSPGRDVDQLSLAWDLARVFPKPVSIPDALWLEFAELLGLPPVDPEKPECTPRVLVQAAVEALRRK